MTHRQQTALKEAFASRVTPGGKPGFEAWFSIFMEPKSQRALWLRYTRLAPKDGREPTNVIWASLFDANAPQKHVYVAETMPDSFLDPAAHRDGGFVLTTDRIAGAVATPKGKLRWDLKLSGECGLFNPLPNWLTRLPVGGAKDLVLDPRMTAAGTVQLGDEVMSFNGTRGQMHHMWGTFLSQEIYYLYIPVFDDDPEGRSLEAVAVKPDGMSPFLTWAVLGRPGQVRSSGGLYRALRSGFRADYPNFGMQVRGAQFDVSINARMPSGQITAYQFRDPDGRPRFVEQSDVCAAEVSICEGGKTQRLRSARGTVMEFHRMTPWSALNYLDPFGTLFNK